MSIEIRPATRADIEAFYGQQPRFTTKALVVLKDNDIVAVAGITFRPDCTEAFSDFRPVDVPKRTIWRYAEKLRDLISRERVPLVAIANKDIPNSAKFLTKLGFQYCGEHENNKIYRLKREASSGAS